MATSDRQAEIESYRDYMGVFCAELLHFFVNKCSQVRILFYI